MLSNDQQLQGKIHAFIRRKEVQFPNLPKS